MKNYLIINGDTIQKRIEELKNYCVERKLSPTEFATFNHTILELKQILSQSTPLIPEIEKALKVSIPICAEHTLDEAVKITEDYKKWYISNLKLDI